MAEMDGAERAKLEEEHSHSRVRQRVSEPNHGYVGDAILGAVDGGVTTLAVITGALGGGFGGQVVVVLGFAKLFADGFSMAASSFLRARSEGERIEHARETERHHIRHIPEGERREIRHIFAEKGLEGEVLDRVVETITQDEDRWINVMLTDELNLPREAPSPIRAAASTFLAFLAVGVIPLAPFLVPGLPLQRAFWASVVLTAVAFVVVGVLKARALKRPVVRSGLETLLVGGGAAVVAYVVSLWLRDRFGVA